MWFTLRRIQPSFYNANLNKSRLKVMFSRKVLDLVNAAYLSRQTAFVLSSQVYSCDFSLPLKDASLLVL